MNFANLVPVRETYTELGWLRSVSKFVSAECAADTEWSRSYKAARSKQDTNVKAFCDELRPFRYYADSMAFSDDVVFKLREAGHRVDLSYQSSGQVKDLQITVSFSDTGILHPEITRLEGGNFSPGYQRALANEVCRRDGSSSDQTLYIRDQHKQAIAIEDSERMHTAQELSLALVSGLKSAVRRKTKFDYGDCELLVWHAEYEGYYEPDFVEIALQAWDQQFSNHFEAVHFLFGRTRVSLDRYGSVA